MQIEVAIPINELAAVLRKAAGNIKVQDRALVRGLNDGADKFRTLLKRDLQSWTGIKVQKRLLDGMSIRKASSANWTATLAISDRYLKITPAYFGAKWKRGRAFATSSAWGAQGKGIHPHAFFAGKHVPLFVRTSKDRKKIRPLFGPNPAQEAKRHLPLVQATLAVVMHSVVVPRVARHIEQAFKEAR